MHFDLAYRQHYRRSILSSMCRYQNPRQQVLSEIAIPTLHLLSKLKIPSNTKSVASQTLADEENVSNTLSNGKATNILAKRQAGNIPIIFSMRQSWSKRFMTPIPISLDLNPLSLIISQLNLPFNIRRYMMIVLATPSEFLPTRRRSLKTSDKSPFTSLFSKFSFSFTQRHTFSLNFSKLPLCLKKKFLCHSSLFTPF